MLEGIRQFLFAQRAALKRADIELFLRDMINFFKELSAAEVMQGRHLPCKEFDILCQQAGQLSVYELLAKVDNLPGIVHDVVLVTELFHMGGHAELVRDILRASEVPVLLIVTNINDRDKPVIEVILEEKNLLSVINLSESSYLTRLRTLQFYLANHNLRNTYMLTHAYDAVAVAAVSPKGNSNILFFHHCDHSPALGCFIEGAKHVDLHNIGFLQCRHNLNITSNRYICLTSMNLKRAREDWRFASPCFKTASCGGMHKISDVSYHLDYKTLVLRVLQKLQGVHFHIGYLSSEFLTEMNNLLINNGLLSDQFVYVGDAPGLPEILTQLEIDLYMPTLPQSGGKAVIDVMSAGIPILAHQHANDRLLCGIDLVYPSAVTWANFEELDQVLENYDEAFWLEQSSDSRKYFERYHSDQLFVSQLAQNGVNMESPDIPPMKAYKPDIAYHLKYAGFRQ